MRPLPAFILAYLILGLQAGLGAYVGVRGVTPNLVLLVAIFYAIHAPRDAALLACYCVGLMQDLLSSQPLGLYAFAYGLVGLLVNSAAKIVYARHPLTHVSMASVGGLITAAVLLAYDWRRPPGPGAMHYFTGVVYTALLAPIVIWPLQRMRKVFNFQSNRLPKRMRA